MSIHTRLNVAAWFLSATVTVLAIAAWGQGLRWELLDLSTYQLFPLFGLLAFSLMWAHYVVAAFRRHLGIAREKLSQYFEITSALVLITLLMHPGLLIWQLWRDGFGLPPGSYKAYVGKALVWLVVLGTISLIVFLVYELRHIFAKRDWWKFVQYANDVAIILIYYHGLRLGGELQNGWYKVVWISYGISLAAVLCYSYFSTYRKGQGTIVD